MEGLVILILLVALAIPVSILILFVKVGGLKDRIAALEAQLAATIAQPELAPRPIRAEVLMQLAPTPPVDAPDPAAPPLAEAAPSPWDRAKLDVRPAEPAGQNRPLVMRPDRFADLARWLRDNWVYAVSALSLALAGVFFVQYGMERGLLPPGARVLAALAFGAGLIGAGEWLRRRHGDEGDTTTRHLPSVFSGAGIVTLFAATLAARHLYSLIGAEAAFAAHLATAVLAVVLGWFSGPLLVAVGLLGATAAPFVVAGGSAAGPWLYGYFTLIAATGLAVDAVRRWAWVSVLALVLAFVGGWLALIGGAGDAGAIAGMVALALLAITVPQRQLIPLHDGPATLPALLTGGKLDWPPFPVRLAFGTMLAASVGLFFATAAPADTALMAMAALALLALLALLWADKAEGLADLALAPSLAFWAGLAAQGADRWPLMRDFAGQAIALRPPETAAPLTISLLLAMATLMGLAAAYRALRPGPWPIAFGLGAVLTPPLAAATLELLWQPALVLGPYPWALHLIGLAALATGLALRFAKADAPDMRRAAHATLAALALIALALFLLTTKTALTLALAALVVVAAALDRRFRLPEMSLFLQAGAAVLGYRLLADPGIGWALQAPLLQTLLAFGGTIAAMLAALWLLRPLDRPMAAAVAESAAAGLAAILANVLITRWLDTPESYGVETHWGLTLNALPWVILMLMQLYRSRIGGWLRRLRLALAGLGAVIGLGGLGMAATLGNPVFSTSADQTGALVRGPLVLDSLLLAYGLPGLLLLAAAKALPGLTAPLSRGLLALGAALAALYAGLEIRRFWQGDWLGIPGVTQPELYTYTLALMLLGAALLYQAIARRSDTLRRIAMAVIALTVAKVFLIDAAGLTGLTRVISFAGLGLSLAGLAWLNRWAGSRA